MDTQQFCQIAFSEDYYTPANGVWGIDSKPIKSAYKKFHSNLERYNEKRTHPHVVKVPVDVRADTRGASVDGARLTPQPILKIAKWLKYM